MVKNATVDVNCGRIFQNDLPTALSEGQVEESTINESFARMARIQFRLGLFDSTKKSAYNPEADIASIDSADHQQLALEAALQSIVLLQNKKATLPLDLENTKSIAVIGPHIHAQSALMGNYHGAKCVCRSDGGISKDFSCVETPLQAIQRKMKSTDSVKSMEGCGVTDGNMTDIDKATELAKNSDKVILFLGLDQGQEAEGRDRYETILPGLQPQLLENILDVAGPKTVVVLIHGGTISLGDIREKAGAIVSAGYGGQAASSAIASVLFGEYNPTGKLAATVYPASFINELPLTEMGLRVGVGRTYMYYTGEAEFAFGHGLSYSSWKLNWTNGISGNQTLDETASAPALKLHESTPTRLHIRVENTGPHTSGSHQTVLLFWHPVDEERISDSKVIDKNEGLRLQRKLIDFQETSFLVNGHSETIEFELVWDDFAMWDSSSNRSKVGPGMYELVAEVADSRLTRLLELIPVEVPHLRQPQTTS